MSSISRPLKIFIVSATGVATVLPPLLVIDAPPIRSFYPEVTALLGWGLWSAAAARVSGGYSFWRQLDYRSRALLAVFLILLAAVWASVLAANLPLQIAVRHSAILLAAVLVARAAASLDLRRYGSRWLLGCVMAGLAVAGVANASIACLQFLRWDGLIEPMPLYGRAVGHLAQPNLLATQVLWGLLALIALRECNACSRPILFVGGLLSGIAIALSASRTGAAACVGLAVWGLCDKRLTHLSRWSLMMLPIAVAACGALLYLLGSAAETPSAETRQLGRTGLADTRFVLWMQCLNLIKENALTGVGWGQFNFAWTLTPMDAARTAGYTFTHAHNLLLQMAVELGIPLAAVCVALVATAFVGSCRRIRQHPHVYPKVALAMTAVVLWHSMLEFPLWYAHFLLPTAALLGFACAATSAQTEGKPRSRGTRCVVSGPALGGLVSLCAVIGIWQYQPVSDFFHPPNDGLSDAQRVERARESWLFGHFVDRYNATLYKSSEGRALQSLQVIKFEMLDVRLLQAWADAEWENGHEDKAQFIASRTREFNTPAVQRWFERCEQVGDYFCSGRDLKSTENMTFRNLR